MLPNLSPYVIVVDDKCANTIMLKDSPRQPNVPVGQPHETDLLLPLVEGLAMT